MAIIRVSTGENFESQERHLLHSEQLAYDQWFRLFFQGGIDVIYCSGESNFCGENFHPCSYRYRESQNAHSMLHGPQSLATVTTATFSRCNAAFRKCLIPILTRQMRIFLSLKFSVNCSSTERRAFQRPRVIKDVVRFFNFLRQLFEHKVQLKLVFVPPASIPIRIFMTLTIFLLIFTIQKERKLTLEPKTE